MEFNKENMPKHIAIIMDGNRRWARAQGKPASFGHKAGAKTLEKIVRYANKIGLEYITVYAFSTENWKRTEEEVKNKFCNVSCENQYRAKLKRLEYKASPKLCACCGKPLT